MKIYRPVKKNHQSQKFGQSGACVKVGANGPIRPFQVINKNGTCPAGYKDFYTAALGMKGHNGEDWTTAYKDPCYFPVDAETEWYAKSASDKDGGIGVDVYSKIRIPFPILPKEAGPQARKEWLKHKALYVKFRFWHLHSFTVSKKAPVKLGQLIGYCDSTGASSGNHLHWSMKFVDEKDVTLDNNNGYTGAVDFSAYFENMFILDEIRTREENEKTEEIITGIQQAVEELPSVPEPQRTYLVTEIVRIVNELLRFFAKK